MARQRNPIFIGRIGNIVGSTWKGIPYIRSMPDSIRQSPAMLANNALLGSASAMGAAFRRVAAPLLPNATDRAMQNRLTGTLKVWLKTQPLQQPLPVFDIPALSGFDCVAQAPLRSRFRITPTWSMPVAGRLSLQLPAYLPLQHITAPVGCRHLVLRYAAATYALTERCLVGSWLHNERIAYHHAALPEQATVLPYTIPPASLTMLFVALNYEKPPGHGQPYDTRPAWQPAGVLAACLV